MSLSATFAPGCGRPNGREPKGSGWHSDELARAGRKSLTQFRLLPVQNSKPNSSPRMESLLYVAEWADTILTAFNHWLNSAGIGDYPVWEGPQVAEFARVAGEYAQLGRMKHADVYECVEADLKRSEVYDDARALLKRADVHFSRLLSWCQETAKAKQDETKRNAIATPKANSKAKRHSGGRTKDPKVQARNKNIVAAFKNGSNIDAVCERFKVSDDTARHVRSDAYKSGDLPRPKNRRS